MEETHSGGRGSEEMSALAGKAPAGPDVPLQYQRVQFRRHNNPKRERGRRFPRSRFGLVCCIFSARSFSGSAGASPSRGGPPVTSPAVFQRVHISARRLPERDYLKMRVAAIPKAIASARRKTQMYQSLRPRVGSKGMCGMARCWPEEGGRGVGRRTLAGVAGPPAGIGVPVAGVAGRSPTGIVALLFDRGAADTTRARNSG